MKKQFGFKIVNSASSDCIVALFPGNLETVTHVVTQSGTTPFAVSAIEHAYTAKAALNAYGIPVDASLDDGTISTSVVATSRNAKNRIRHFLNYIKLNPLRLTKLTIQGSNQDVFNESIFVQPDSPVHGTATQEIPLNAALDKFQVQDNKIELLPNLPVFDETVMWMRIPAGRTVQFDMEFADFNPWN
jgi:hypothetical protein